jgi:3-deoxy-D-manno-octulosonate 8-phosphate phosphatase KdsC-like HAD superfamily phosphatase
VQILPLGASKGQAVEWLLNHLSVDPADCVAFGDGENDIEMLQLVGVRSSLFAPLAFTASLCLSCEQPRRHSTIFLTSRTEVGRAARRS